MGVDLEDGAEKTSLGKGGDEPCQHRRRSICRRAIREAAPIAAGMTGGELAEAKRYGRFELALHAGRQGHRRGLSGGGGVPPGPARSTTGCKTYPLLAGNWSLRLVALFLVVMAIHVAVSFPLSFYSGHVLEHRFHLSTQTLRPLAVALCEAEPAGRGLSLVLVLGLYWLIWTTGGWWWLAAAAAFFVVSIVLGQLAPVLILPLFYKIEKLDAPELTDRIGPAGRRARACRSKASTAWT